jgi:hypothetical protein
MLIQIITRTPVWVWAILVLLLWIGLKQSVPRSISLRRITVLPVVMVGLSLAGLLAGFGTANHALLAWGLAAAVAMVVVMTRRLPQATHYNAWTQQFHIPGSWTPLVLMMGIFITKYAVGVTLAMHPDLARDMLFSQSVGALYGGFSGVFAARAAQLWRLASAKTNGTTVPQGV